MRATACSASGEREAELLVLVGRREEVVGLGVHAADDPHQHALDGAGPRGDRRQTLDLDRAVDDDRADADLDGALELGDRLVVAVEAEGCRSDARRERDLQLAAGAHVDAESFVDHPARDRRGQQRLARVVHLRGRAVVAAAASKAERKARARERTSSSSITSSGVPYVCGESGRGDAGDPQFSVGDRGLRRPATRRRGDRSRRRARRAIPGRASRQGKARNTNRGTGLGRIRALRGCPRF